MKLKTSLTASRDGSMVDATDENLIHDAAVAHALMQALADADIEDFESFSSTWVTQIMERADALLKQWGFDTGEDA